MASRVYKKLHFHTFPYPNSNV